MRWFPWEERDKRQAPGRPIASSAEIDSVFNSERGYLLWTVQVITGSDHDASLSIVEASLLASKNTSIFQDWLTRWAHSATARTAITTMRASFVATESQNAESPCTHLSHEVLTESQIAALRLLSPMQIAAELDPVARTVLVLRGVQHDSVFECALLLNVPRGTVGRAYCRALQWANKRLGVLAVTAGDLVPTGRSCAQLGA